MFDRGRNRRHKVSDRICPRPTDQKGANFLLKPKIVQLQPAKHLMHSAACIFSTWPESLLPSYHEESETQRGRDLI